MSAKRANSYEGPHSPDRYSDDFDSDDDKRSQKEKQGPTPKRNSGHQYYQDKFHLQRRGSGNVRGQVQGRGLRKGRGNSGASEPDMKKHNDTITSRVLSASRNRISELRNKIEELKIKIRDLEQENKLYKTMQFRQEKAIKTFADKENDLPMILDKHNNEVRVLKEQNRRLREKFEKSDRYLRDAEDELEKVKKKMRKYKEICEDKELMERDDLTRRLEKRELEMEEKEAQLKDLQKHIEVLIKSHRHEMGIGAARQREVKKQLEVLKERNAQLESLIKEKEKALDHQNIHSNTRQGRSSRSNSPGGSLTRKSKRKTTSMTELTSRDKAKYYSEKQRSVVHKQKEELQKRSEQQKVDSTIARNDEEIKETDEKEKKEQWKLQELKRKETEEYEREEYEKKEMREKLKLDSQEKAVEEGKQLLQKEKLENDLVLQADRKKKDDLLRKLKIVDEMGSAAASDPFWQASPIKKNKDQTNEMEEYSFTKPINNSRHNATNKDTAKPPLEHQKNKRQTSGEDSGGYQPSFGPARGSMNKPRAAVVDDDDEPAFKITNSTSSNTNLQENKKPNLLESLFGPQANLSKNVSAKKVEGKENLFTTNQILSSGILATAGSNGETKSGSIKTYKSTFYPNHNSTIFGGDTSLIDSNLLDNYDKVSSHRQKQHPKTFSAKPSGTLVDNFDDEIEEVVL